MSLTNHILVALPQLQDPNFGRSFVQICSHSPAGAMGFVLNKPMNKQVVESLSTHIHLDSKYFRHVFWGGPVQLDTVLVIHSPDHVLPGTKNYGNYSISKDRQIIRDINAGKLEGEFKIFLGHSTWSPTQLEHEIHVRKNWSHFQSDNEWIFSPMLHWEDALITAGESQAQNILDRIFQQ